MNRVGDHIQFAAGFVGIGYMMLWPLTAHDQGLAPLVCERPASLLAGICHAPHEVTLSPGLHALGLLSSVYVAVRLLLHVCSRLREKWGRPLLAVKLPAVVLTLILKGARGSGRASGTWRRLRPQPPPRRYVVPRHDFGLRGLRH